MGLLTKVSFKSVYLDDNNQYSCSDTCDYDVNPNWTLKNFIKFISINVKNSGYFSNNQELEIVPAGHEKRELADSVPSSNVLFKHKYNLKMAFYVRIKRIVGVMCNICYINNELIRISGCSHSICNNCIIQCITTNNRHCPFCRVGWVGLMV